MRNITRAALAAAGLGIAVTACASPSHTVVDKATPAAVTYVNGGSGDALTARQAAAQIGATVTSDYGSDVYAADSAAVTWRGQAGMIDTFVTPSAEAAWLDGPGAGQDVLARTPAWVLFRG
jgi:hypothetical protein